MPIGEIHSLKLYQLLIARIIHFTILSSVVPCLKIVTEVTPISDTLISSQWSISSDVGVVWNDGRQKYSVTNDF